MFAGYLKSALKLGNGANFHHLQIDIQELPCVFDGRQLRRTGGRVPKAVTLERVGMASFSSSSHFVPKSGKSENTPVMLPPGCARLATNPAPTGSLSRSLAMIGIVVVADFADRSADGLMATIASTFCSTRSAASAARHRRLLPRARRRLRFVRSEDARGSVSRPRQAHVPETVQPARPQGDRSLRAEWPSWWH